MQHARFMVLTGHLKDYPLSDIFGILRHQRKTGRLLIDYPAAPGVFFLKDGELVDARMGALKGVQAVLVATKQPDAPFNFNPLMQPSEQSISNPLQKVVLEMLGCWQDEVVINTALKSEPHVIESAGGGVYQEDAAFAPLNFERKVLPEGRPPALPAPVFSHSHKQSNKKRGLIFAGTLLLLVSIPTVAALTGIFGRAPVPAAARVESGSSIEPVESGKSKDEAMAAAPSENIDGDFGFSDIEQGTNQTEGADSNRGKVKQSPRAQAPKKLESEIAGSQEATPSAQDKKTAEVPSAKEGAPSDNSTITVVTQVENGRVVQAYVANRRAGMEAFEASALRAARQRHYPPGTKGSEKVQIKVVKQ